jgi:hypothetical protein
LKGARRGRQGTLFGPGKPKSGGRAKDRKSDKYLNRGTEICVLPTGNSRMESIH